MCVTNTKHFLFVTQMFIFSLEYEMWSVLLFLFCSIRFVFVTQMFIFSLDYEVWSYSREKINICATHTKRIKQNKNNKTPHFII
jgi:hypothetical protein